MNRKTERFFLIDGIRGIAVLNMVFYHLLWDLVYILGLRLPWFHSAAAQLWQQAICHSFILISGFCFYLSKNSLKNALVLLVFGSAVTVVTLLFSPSSAIYFGVLFFLGAATLIAIPLRPLLLKMHSLLGGGLALILFVLTKSINSRSLLFGAIRLPSFVYKNMLTAFLGFPPRSFFSSDYFSLLPWFFLFLLGFFVAKGLLGRGNPPKFLYFRLGFFEWLGRYSLIIYMLHQPLLYGLSLLIGGI